jgi:two-component system, oxyanion-binding sensor
MSPDRKIKIGFIPLADAATLFVALDKGYAAAEGLDVELVREVSWSNIRDRLAIGHYDAAHLLAPMAIASTLGLSHLKMPTVATFNLALNGNAITVSPDLHARLRNVIDGDISDPAVTARALHEIVRERERRNEEPLSFGMTFPFSAHNYQLRYWMAEGGIDPDKDIRLVVLPPPYMVENLARGQVDGFCVGAPWNTVAARAGVGVVLHPGAAIFSPTPEKTLAFRQTLAQREPGLVEALIRACLKAAAFVKEPENLDEVAALLARPDRVGADAQALRRTLEGRIGSSAAPANENYLIFGDHRSGRPDPLQAAWIYAQMLRWGQTRFTAEHFDVARKVFDPAYFDSATNASFPTATPRIAAFAGAAFDGETLDSYLRSFAIGATG